MMLEIYSDKDAGSLVQTRLAKYFNMKPYPFTTFNNIPIANTTYPLFYTNFAMDGLMDQLAYSGYILQ